MNRSYQYVYWDKGCGGDLFTHLGCKKQRRKRYGTYYRRGKLVNQVSIDERPAIVEERTRAGDWELDTIIGKNHKQAIVTMTERSQRLTYFCKVETKDAKSVEDAIVKTADNGREFGNHENIARRLKADFYFAHPYNSRERGANENSNGLVRQYFPKGSDFAAIETKDLRRVERRLNNRPRKYLEMKTPNEVALGLHPILLLLLGFETAKFCHANGVISFSD